MYKRQVLGIPNVGKSTFINKVAKRKTARAEDRPGVTRSKQWVPVDATLELLDTPGILWPKFDDTEVGKRLAFTGAIKDDVLDIEELACYLMENCTTVNLFIGKAINKDYTTKELPFEISVRQNLMKRMQTVLTAMHRTVHVYYY